MLLEFIDKKTVAQVANTLLTSKGRVPTYLYTLEDGEESRPYIKILRPINVYIRQTKSRQAITLAVRFCVWGILRGAFWYSTKPRGDNATYMSNNENNMSDNETYVSNNEA